MRPRQEERFELQDPRDIDALYPDQWVAFEIAEIAPGVGITKGRIIARGKSKQKVAKALNAFIQANPEKPTAFFDTGPWLKPDEDVILAAN